MSTNLNPSCWVFSDCNPSQMNDTDQRQLPTVYAEVLVAAAFFSHSLSSSPALALVSDSWAIEGARRSPSPH
jgi:hypothetical protein